MVRLGATFAGDAQAEMSSARAVAVFAGAVAVDAAVIAGASRRHRERQQVYPQRDFTRNRQTNRLEVRCLKWMAIAAQQVVWLVRHRMRWPVASESEIQKTGDVLDAAPEVRVHRPLVQSIRTHPIVVVIPAVHREMRATAVSLFA